MGRINTLRDLIGIIKDKASISKATLISKPNALSLRLAVLRATTHSPLAPPDDHRLSTLLFLGDSSRATASAIIIALTDRLHRTGNCVVALKCLVIIHHIIRRGPFILQDQLAVVPVCGGYNYLKLSDFRDGATATTWALSAWVRWYARYLETLLSSSRVLGYFLSSSVGKENQEQRVSSFLNVDLIKEVDFLVSLMEEICEVPDSILVDSNMLVNGIIGLLSSDYSSAASEISLRLSEFKNRLNGLSFSDSIQLVCGLNRLQDCKEKLSILFTVRKPSIETLWCLTEELRDEVGMLKVYKEGGKFLTYGEGPKWTQSARFDQQVMKAGNSIRFHSGRFLVTDRSLFLMESVNSHVY